MKKLFPYVHSFWKKIGLGNFLYKDVEPINFIVDNLFLGDFRAADDIGILRKNNISNIINCAFNLPNKFPKEITYINLNLMDETKQPLIKSMEDAYKFIKDNKDKKILVHCVYGKSRSASVIIFYLIKEKKMSFQEAKEFVRKIRSCVNPNEGFEKELTKYYDENIANSNKDI